MYRLALLAAAFVCSLAAQCPRIETFDYSRSALAGAEIGRLLAESVRLGAETEAIRSQTLRLRRQHQGLRMADIVSDPVAWARFETLMVKRLPDFNDYRADMARLTTLFEQGDASLAEYVEGLYAIAKHASFSKSAHP